MGVPVSRMRRGARKDSKALMVWFPPTAFKRWASSQTSKPTREPVPPLPPALMTAACLRSISYEIISTGWTFELPCTKSATSCAASAPPTLMARGRMRSSPSHFLNCVVPRKCVCVRARAWGVFNGGCRGVSKCIRQVCGEWP